MQLCCCASFENLPLVTSAGYDRIALPGTFLAACGEETFAEICAAAAEGRLVCRSLNAFCPADIKLVGEGYAPRQLGSYSRALAARAARIGVEAVGIGSPNSRQLPADFDRGCAMRQWQASLRIISEEFGGYGISVLAEPLCTLECNWMNTTDEVRETVELLAIPNLGMVFDMYHAFVMGEDDAPLRRAMPYVREVHIAQFINGEKHYLHPDHSADCAPYFSALRELGYDGEIAVEAAHGSLPSALPRSLKLLRAWASGEQAGAGARF